MPNTDDLNRTVFISDNLPFLKSLDTESVDLVCIDPPFGKNQTFSGNLKPPLSDAELEQEYNLLDQWGIQNENDAYELGVEFPDQSGTTASFRDIWDFRYQVTRDEWDMLDEICRPARLLIEATRYTHSDAIAGYIAFMTMRMLEIRRILKDTGSVYLHCDHKANAYLRQMMDAVFGEDRLLNELIWYYRGAGTPKDAYARRHDTIFWYAKEKGKHYFDADPIRQEYAKATTERFQHHIGNVRGAHDYGVQTLNPKGKHPDDVITNVQPIAPSAKERTGYPTQKPQALARRIIESSSKLGDLVLDCFAGCAYVPVAAELTGRHWIACDMSPRAWTVVRRQFHKQPDLRIVTEGEYTEYDTGVQPDLAAEERIIRVRGPHDLPELTTDSQQSPLGMPDKPPIQFRQRALEDSQTIWEAFVEHWGTGCWYCGTEKAKDRRELQLDHIEPNKRDGTNDDCWNRALACVPCNSDKGNRLTAKQTIRRAFDEERIATQARLDEVLAGFERRHQWAKTRWEGIRLRKTL